MRITKLVALPALAVGLVVGAPAAAQATESVTACVQSGTTPCPPQTCDVHIYSERTTMDEHGNITSSDARQVCVRSDTASGVDALLDDVLILVDDLLP